MESKDSKFWIESINDELNALKKNDTWEITSLPPGRRAIDTKWVFKIKRHPNGKISRFKSRLCARGFTQEKGIDYNETFAPTTRFDSIRVLLSIAAKYDYEIMQFDIKTAFLYGELQEEIYLSPPEGTNIDSNKVCKLKKSLYGLKQAPHCWNKKFHTFLDDFGFIRCNADNCVYVGFINNTKVLLILYVDDGLIFTETTKAMEIVLTHLKNNFEVTIEQPTYFVGMEIERNRDEKSIFIHQTNYINRLISKFNQDSAKPIDIPSDPHSNLSAAQTDEEIRIDVPYREAVGSLIFASTVCRPDISYSVGVVSRFLASPTNAHWNGVKRIIRCLINTNNYGIKYSYSQQPDSSKLIGYSDADYANDLDTRRSTSGYIFLFNSGPVSWSSQRQHSVALSTTEAEYIAACAATKEVIWLRQLLKDIHEPIKEPSTIFIDNQSAIKLIHNPEFHKRTKHIDVRYHFIREKLQSGEIDAKYKCSKLQLADVLTKPLPRSRFTFLRDSLNIESN